MSQTKHSRQVAGLDAAGDFNVLQTAAAWHQISLHHTPAPALIRHRFIRHRPGWRPLSFCPPLPLFLSLPLSHHTLFFSRWRGRERGREEGWEGDSPGAVTVLSSCSSLSFSFLCFFSLKMYSVVFFSCSFFYREILLLITSISL